MSENYSDIASLSWDNIPQPKTLPTGSWKLRARNATFLPAKSADSNPRVVIFFTPIEPMDDVDESRLSELGDGYDFAANQIVHNVFIEGPRDWANVRSLLEKMDVQVEGPVQETLKKVRGKEVIAYLGTRTFTDSTGEPREENTAAQFAKID